MTETELLPVRALAVQLYRIAADHAGGLREGLTRGCALKGLAAVSTDPGLLAEAAAAHAMGENWYAIVAVDLLIEAGADRAQIDVHAGLLADPADQALAERGPGLGQARG